jgi:hypothetical protein
LAPKLEAELEAVPGILPPFTSLTPTPRPTILPIFDICLVHIYNEALRKRIKMTNDPQQHLAREFDRA